MLTECPNCSWSDEVEDEFLGQEAECPSCENDFIVTEKRQTVEATPKLKVAKRPQTRAPEADGASNTGEFNPYAAPKSATRPARQAALAKGTYPGIGRLHYFLLSLGANILSVLLNLALPLLGTLIALIAGFFIVISRLRNLGYNPWLSLLMLVPLANLWLSVVCIACPEGYADHKKYDTPGKVIVGLILGVFVIAMLVLFSTFKY